GLLANTHRVTDLCTVLDLAALSDGGALVDRHLRTDADVRLDLHVAAKAGLGANGDLFTEDRTVSERGACLDGRVLPDRDALSHGGGFDQPRPLRDVRADAERGPVTDHDALADRDVRSDGHVRADDGIVTDGDARVDPSAGVDLDILTELRTSPLLRTRHVGLAPGDGAEFAPVAGLPRIALAHLRSGTCPYLRRRHDRLPSSSWSHRVEVGGADSRSRRTISPGLAGPLRPCLLPRRFVIPWLAETPRHPRGHSRRWRRCALRYPRTPGRRSPVAAN